MNQLLENPAGSEASFASDTLTDAAVAVKGRVLLLEDDDSLRETITDYLLESGYTVVAVQNGTEGVREVLAEDYTLILCDMMMPSVAGPTFYRAVERVRPGLCERFVFMTGYREDAKTNEFIKSINGYVLRKPFPLTYLLSSIALAEVRRTFRSVFDSTPDDAAPTQVFLPRESRLREIETRPSDRANPELSPSEQREHPIGEQPARNERRETPLQPGNGKETSSIVAGASGLGRVLLVDDDSSFNGIIRDFLTENGFTVVAVHSGGDGIREILAGEFALVLCDLMMPSLPGDVFYNAVERIRPNLCSRFLFMSGYRGDDKTSAFIERVKGHLLRKPFHLQDLLDAIAVIKTRDDLPRASPSVFSAPAPRPVPSPEAPVPTRAPLRPSGSSPAKEAPAPPPKPSSVPHQLPDPRVATAPTPRKSSISSTFTPAGLALVAVLAVNLGFRIPHARERAAAASSDRMELEAEWGRVSERREDAEESRSTIVSLQKLATRLGEESHGSGWTEALRVVANLAGPEISLREVAAHCDEGPPGSSRLLIQGFATGGNPRAIANTFHESLRREAAGIFAGAVTTELVSLEEVPKNPSASSGLPRARFRIALTISPEARPKLERGATK